MRRRQMMSSLELERGGDDTTGWPVPVPQRWVSGESEMFQNPVREASDEVERWADTLTRAC
jgi:hypothetical protein